MGHYERLIKSQLKVQPWGRRVYDDMITAVALSIAMEEGDSTNVVFSLSSRAMADEVLWVFTDSRLFFSTRDKSKPTVQVVPLVNIAVATSKGERISLFGVNGLALHLKHTGSEKVAQDLANSINAMREYFVGNGFSSVLTAVALDQAVTAHGLPGISAGRPVFLEVHPDGIRFGAIGALPVDVPFTAIDSMGVGGPGEVKTGGGFIGGGIGLEGMAIGLATASLLNLVTSSTQVETFLVIRGTTCEFVGMSTLHEPMELDSLLAPGYTALRAAQRSREAPTAIVGASVSEELMRLVELRESGHLNDQEFQVLKARIVDS